MKQSAVDDLAFQIPMRGNERKARAWGRVIPEFQIPMRGNERKARAWGRVIPEFQIPMRGNESVENDREKPSATMFQIPMRGNELFG